MDRSLSHSEPMMTPPWAQDESYNLCLHQSALGSPLAIGIRPGKTHNSVRLKETLRFFPGNFWEKDYCCSGNMAD